jgi:hypothetical protein
LCGDFVVGQVGQKTELALRDTAHGIGHHENKLL